MCATGVCGSSHQGSRVLPHRTVDSHHSSPATKIEGPGTAWAFVQSGADSTEQSTNNKFRMSACLVWDYGHEFTGDGLSWRWVALSELPWHQLTGPDAREHSAGTLLKSYDVSR